MDLTLHEKNGVKVASIQTGETLIFSSGDALDLLAQAYYDYGCNRVILPKSAFTEDFFHLETRLAGEILQKFSNYRFKLAIVGDFSIYASKSLRDFIRECNRGHDIFFLPSEEEALERFYNEPSAD